MSTEDAVVKSLEEEEKMEGKGETGGDEGMEEGVEGKSTLEGRSTAAKGKSGQTIYESPPTGTKRSRKKQ